MTGGFAPPPLPKEAQMRSIKLYIILRLAKLLRVPVNVGYSFLANGKNSRKPGPGSLI